jgi:DNA modification methylase
VLLTDPPYGVDYRGKTKRSLRIANDDGNGIADLLSETFPVLDKVLAPGTPIYLFHPAGPASAVFVKAFLDVGWQIRQGLVWVKDALVLGHGDYHFRHEPIIYGTTPGGRLGRGRARWYGGHAQTSVFEVPRPRASLEHPTAKPVALISQLVANSSRIGDVVLDPFLGSGTTLIAAEQLGRRCCAIEIDARYADVAIARWEAFTGRQARKVESDGT